MKEIENSQTSETQALNIPVVSTRTFLFKGWNDGKLIEETIEAPDRESAIADIETKYPNYNFPLSQELF